MPDNVALHRALRQSRRRRQRREAVGYLAAAFGIFATSLASFAVVVAVLALVVKWVFGL